MASLLGVRGAWLGLLTASLLAGEARAGEVWVVASGPLQPTVDAAADGDLILLTGSGYLGYDTGAQVFGVTIDGKSLSIVGDDGALADITGGIAVRNLAADQQVLLSGLSLQGVIFFGHLEQTPGLLLRDCLGAVRVQDCELRGNDNFSFGIEEPCEFHADGHGGDGARVVDCADATFTECLLVGGRGAVTCVAPPTGVGGGGAGITVLDSRVALFACEANGGRGGSTGFFGGFGGSGANWNVAPDLSGLASGSSFRGGPGGFAPQLPGFGGGGGNGLHTPGPTPLAVLDVSLTGGPGGLGSVGLGVPGPEHVGTAVTNYAGVARTLQVPCPLRESTTAAIDLSGAPGDFGFLGLAVEPAHLPLPAWLGVLLVDEPLVLPLGFVGPTGTATFSVPVGALPAGVQFARAEAQGVMLGSEGQVVLASPRSVVLLDDAF